MKIGSLVGAAVLMAGGVLAVAGCFAYRDWRTDSAKLQNTLATQQQAVSAAQQRERTRDEQLASTLAEIAAVKAKTQTPAQILQVLPRYLPLPEPLRPAETMMIAGQESNPGASVESTGGRNSAPNGNNTMKGSTEGNSAEPALGASQTATADAASGGLLRGGKNTAGGVLLPSSDLKPLFDYVQDCRACQAKLATTQQDLADEQSKEKALVAQRGALIKAAKGGGFWKRVKHNAKWFGAGMLAGGIAVAVASVR